MGSAQGGEKSGSLKGWFNKSMFMVVDQCFLRIRILWRHRHDLGKGWVLMSIQEICSTETNYKRLNSTPPDQQNNCTSHKDGPFPAILGDMKYCARFFFSRRNATKPSSMFCFFAFLKTHPTPNQSQISHWFPTAAHFKTHRIFVHRIFKQQDLVPIDQRRKKLHNAVEVGMVWKNKNSRYITGVIIMGILANPPPKATPPKK